MDKEKVTLINLNFKISFKMEEKCDLSTHIHKGILFGHKEKEILPFVTTWINLEGCIQSEINQTQKDKYCMIPLITGT